jgi:hypothetical protein
VPSNGCCANCKSSSGCLTLERHRIDNTQSIQLWSCNICGFKWKEIWSSYSQSIWSLQYQQQQQEQQEQKQEMETIIS